ncbi:MAG: hypothetical protein Q8L66_15900 [Caulobacter sp.]|nr:hypothetical protein [Caulobacter sp.]
MLIEARLFAWFARNPDTPEDELNNLLRQHIADADAKTDKAKTRKRRA